MTDYQIQDGGQPTRSGNNFERPVTARDSNGYPYIIDQARLRPVAANTARCRRPIAITCPVSKVAEVFIARLFDEFFDDDLDEHQFALWRVDRLRLR